MPKVGVNNEPLLEHLIFGYDDTDYRVIKVDDTGQILAAVSIADTVEVIQNTYADLLATVKVAAAQEIEVTQSVAADLLATINIAASQSVIATQSVAANLKVLADINSGQSIAVTQATATNLKAQVTLAADQNVQGRGYGWIDGDWQKQPIITGYSDMQVEKVEVASAPSGTNLLNSTTVPAGEIWKVETVSIRDINSAPSRVDLLLYSPDGSSVIISDLSPGANVWILWQGNMTMMEGEYLQAQMYGITATDLLQFIYRAVRIDIDL